MTGISLEHELNCANAAFTEWLLVLGHYAETAGVAPPETAAKAAYHAGLSPAQTLEAFRFGPGQPLPQGMEAPAAILYREDY